MAESLSKIREELKGLIESSKTLTPDHKQALLGRLGTLDEKRLEELIRVFSGEQQQLKAIDDKYREKETDLKLQYVTTLKQDEGREVKKALKKEESREKQGEEKELETMVAKLEEPSANVQELSVPVKKKAKTKPNTTKKREKTPEAKAPEVKAQTVLSPEKPSKKQGRFTAKALVLIVAAVLIAGAVLYYFLVYSK